MQYVMVMEWKSRNLPNLKTTTEGRAGGRATDIVDPLLTQIES